LNDDEEKEKENIIHTIVTCLLLIRSYHNDYCLYQATNSIEYMYNCTHR